jgi:hypothetical protein
VRDQTGPTEELVAAYQRLVEKEYEKYKELKKSGSGYSFNDQRTFLTEDDISSAGIDKDVFNDMLRRGLIISFGKNLYRTTHFDLIYRLVQVRNIKDQPPLSLEFDIALKKELVPDFGAYEISRTLSEVVQSPHKDLIVKSISTSLYKRGYRGLSSYQYNIIKEMLSGAYKNIAIVAPTASGKTLTFLIPVLIKSVERALQDRAGVAGLLIYPRKALERDQLQSLLQLVHAINEELRSNGKNIITIGIDDGDTKNERWIEDGESFRKLKCVECGGELVIKRENEPLVFCQKCQKEYKYIIPSKEGVWKKKPTILITNIWTIYRRLLSHKSIDIFNDVDFIIIDEAHVYSRFLGGHVSHVLKMLRFVSSLHGNPPVFVFSSATVPNPREFLSNLGRVSKDELFYIDFQETLRNAPRRKFSRILLYLYLLPHPNWDIETLTEALILAITLWCHKNKMKSITFIDSISEINTMMNYIHATILGTREGREVTDHIFKTARSPDDDYCWITLVPEKYVNSSESEFKGFILNNYKQSIGMHYGNLPLEERAEIEEEFSRGQKRMLLSTSTLELGIDLSDVAIILQYKLPLTSEGVVQRVGRAGRDLKCYRIALGVVVLPALPLSTLYMFDEQLRGTLEDVSFLPPLRVGKASHNIGLQHTLSLLLLKRALEGKPTYITEKVKTENDIINFLSCLREIKEELEYLPDFNKTVNLLEEETLKNSIEELKKELTDFLDGLSKISIKETRNNMYEKVDNIEKDIISVLKLADNMKGIVTELSDIIFSTEISSSEVKEWLNRLTGLSTSLLLKMNDIKNLIHKAIEIKESCLVREWLRENRNILIEMTNRLAGFRSSPREMFFKINEYLPNKKDSDRIFSKIMKKLGELSENILDTEEKLNNILSEISLFESIDLRALYAKKVLDKVREKIKIDRRLDIFQILNLLLENKIYFSSLLEAPFPDLELGRFEET